ncbi:FIVAR domain-containing protein [Verrucomicrobiota bacterium]
MNLFKNTIKFGLITGIIVFTAVSLLADYYPFGPYRNGILGGSTDYMKIGAADIGILTNVNQISFGGENRTNWPTAEDWSGYNATQEITWVSSSVVTGAPYAATNIVVTGADLNPNVAGTYTYTGINEDYNYWSSTNNYYIYVAWFPDGQYWIYTALEIPGLDNYFVKAVNIGIPTGSYTAGLSATGTPVAVYSYSGGVVTTNTTTWKAGVDTSDPGKYFISKDGTNVFISYGDSNVWLQPLYGDGSGLTNLTGIPSTNGLASTNWVLSLEYVTASVTNPLASTNWVLSLGYVTAAVTNPLASTNWVLSLGYVTTSITNGLASTSWVDSIYAKPSITNGLASTNVFGVGVNGLVPGPAASTDGMLMADGSFMPYTNVEAVATSLFVNIDGTTPMEGNLNMGGHSITNIADGSLKFADGTTLGSSTFSDINNATNTINAATNTLNTATNSIMVTIANATNTINAATNSLNLQPLWIGACAHGQLGGNAALASAYVDYTAADYGYTYFGTFIIPQAWHGKKLKLTIYWCPTTTDTGDCWWQGSLAWGGIGELYYATTEDSAATMLDAGGGATAVVQVTPTWTTSGTLDSGDMLRVQVNRKGDQIEDDYADNARLIGVLVEPVD